MTGDARRDRILKVIKDAEKLLKASSNIADGLKQDIPPQHAAFLNTIQADVAKGIKAGDPAEISQLFDKVKNYANNAARNDK